MTVFEVVLGVVLGVGVPVGGMLLLVHLLHGLMSYCKPDGNSVTVDDEDEIYHRFYNGRG